jgi:hypothetical protein
MRRNRFIFRRALDSKPAKLGLKHCMVKNIYNAKQNPVGIGAILIQQKSSTKTLMISHNSYTNCDDGQLRTVRSMSSEQLEIDNGLQIIQRSKSTLKRRE